MNTTMARTKKDDEVPDQPGEGMEVTSVKCFNKFRRAVAQLGALLDLNQQEVVDRYQRFIEDDLLREIAKRQAQLKGARPGQ